METKLSDSEAYLWSFIEKNIHRIPDYSITKLSEEASVSTATIVRTMKKKGYDGFTSFKHHLKDNHNTNLNFAAIDKIDDRIKQVILKNEQEVIRTLNMLDTWNIEDAIQKIKAAQRVLIFARGFSELIAEEMTVKFQLTGKYCEFHKDPEIIKNISKKIHHDDTVIFVSLNGETKELVTAAKNCYQNEIGTIAITASNSSSLMQYIDIPLVGYKAEGSLFPDYEVRSRLPLSIIGRILLDAYAIRTM
ncbi:MurR/RpiR family transcriptional regulator [Enterococcus sp. HY326]|uniref:MurR/RpiR family transcriptional regulator n=1 Tax=Enterococcus sp. HY326 TaxID=2971265 RepID=UPI0022401A6C|nr:MurR/RpiR family transcriptional regulator [Enterococcus sp. HY326]